MSTSTFVYLMSVATERYGDIPTGKGDDDGTIFSEFLRESRYPTEQKHVKWEKVRDILEKYKVNRSPDHTRIRCQADSANRVKFIPFCNKVTLKTFRPCAHLRLSINQDPIMTQFPLALAIEPRLLPLAVTNGFTMDSKVFIPIHSHPLFSNVLRQYRDFIFRKMFEKPAFPSDNHAEEIVRHVRELTQLDSRYEESHGHYARITHQLLSWIGCS